MSRSTRQCCVSANKNDGFLRVAAASPQIRVADVEGNAEVALAAVRAAVERGVRALVLPELNLTGYTAADLFHNRTLLHACETALAHILDETRELPIVFTIGLPVAVAENIYNCAAVCCAGELLGLTAKKYLPNYGEFYERRWFAPAPADPVWVEFAGQGPVPLGSGLVYRCCDEGAEDMVLGVEVCEDLWVPAPPSTEMALAGATVILNPSASDEIIGKAYYRRSLISNQSARLYCAYAYADASDGVRQPGGQGQRRRWPYGYQGCSHWSFGRLGLHTSAACDRACLRCTGVAAHGYHGGFHARLWHDAPH